MPPREPKSRRLDREYMADREFMTEFTAEQRECYLLLALFADDAGWLNWDAAQLAADMYRYEPVSTREALLATVAALLATSKRLKIMRCGHAFMPKVAQRPRGHRREQGVLDDHLVRHAHQNASAKHSGSITKASSKGANAEQEALPKHPTARVADLTVPSPNLSSPRTGAHEEGAPVGELREGLRRHGLNPDLDRKH